MQDELRSHDAVGLTGNVQGEGVHTGGTWEEIHLMSAGRWDPKGTMAFPATTSCASTDVLCDPYSRRVCSLFQIPPDERMLGLLTKNVRSLWNSVEQDWSGDTERKDERVKRTDSHHATLWNVQREASDTHWVASAAVSPTASEWAPCWK